MPQQWLTTTPMSPGIEITWLPSVVPYGTWEERIAVPEGTRVGSQAISIPGDVGVADAPLRHPLTPDARAAVDPAPSSPARRSRRVLPRRRCSSPPWRRSTDPDAPGL